MGKTDDTDFQITFYESVYQKDKRDTSVIGLLGSLYTRSGDYKKGLRMDRRLVQLQPLDPVVHYNLACSLALLNRKQEAVNSLRDAISYGYQDFSWLAQDKDLVSLQDFPDFLDLLTDHNMAV